MQKPRRNKRLPKDELFDEARITILPRFKTSEVSGDEWRTSARLQLLRKGEVVYQSGYSTVEMAAAFLPSLLITVMENGEFNDPHDRDKCMQPGCSEKATVTLELKHEYWNCNVIDEDSSFIFQRCFCERHAHRGDSDFEDCDENYVVADGEQPDKSNIPAEDISVARRMVADLSDVDASDPDALGEALQAILKKARGQE